MKRTLSVILALVILVSTLLTTAVILPVFAADVQIAVLNDGTAATTSAVGGNIADWLHAAATSHSATGGHNNGAAIKCDASGYTKISVYNTSNLSNWEGASYLQIYVNAQGSSTTKLEIMLKDYEPAYDGLQSYGLSPTGIVYYSTDGSDFSKTLSVESKEVVTSGTSAGNYGNILIPANFKGYIRIPLNSTNIICNHVWGDNFNGGAAYSTSFRVNNVKFLFEYTGQTTLYVDDIALVGASLSTSASKVSESEYFAAFNQGDKVYVLNDGTEATTSSVSGNISQWLYNASAEHSTLGGHHNDSAVKYSASEYARFRVYNTSSLSDWRGAEYLQLYVNATGSTATYAQIYLKSDANAYDGFQSYNFKTTATAYLSTDGSDWSTRASFVAQDMNTAGSYAGTYGHLVIPANFKGYIRIPLDANTLDCADVWDWNGKADYSTAFAVNNLDFQFRFLGQTTMYVDDIALVGANLSTSAQSVPESEYFAETKVYILNDGTEATASAVGGNISDWLHAAAAAHSANGGHNDGAAIKYDASGYSRLSAYNSENLSDWSGAEYLQFYINAKGSSNTKLDLYLKDYAGAYDGLQSYGLSPNATVNYSTDGKSWTNTLSVESKTVTTEGINAGNYGNLIIPANFKGYIRIALNSTNIINNHVWADWNGGADYSTAFKANNVKFLFEYTGQTTLYVDDIALVGKNISLTDAEAINESSYFMAVNVSLTGKTIKGYTYNVSLANTQEGTNYKAYVKDEIYGWILAKPYGTETEFEITVANPCNPFELEILEEDASVGTVENPTYSKEISEMGQIAVSSAATGIYNIGDTVNFTANVLVPKGKSAAYTLYFSDSRDFVEGTVNGGKVTATTTAVRAGTYTATLTVYVVGEKDYNITIENFDYTIVDANIASKPYFNGDELEVIGNIAGKETKITIPGIVNADGTKTITRVVGEFGPCAFSTATDAVTITKPGLYEIYTEVRTADGNIADTVYKRVRIYREENNVTINSVSGLSATADKDTNYTVTVNATNATEYMFIRREAGKYVIVKDWGEENTWEWTPVRDGIYEIQCYARGNDAGGHEALKIINVNVGNVTGTATSYSITGTKAGQLSTISVTNPAADTEYSFEIYDNYSDKNIKSAYSTDTSFSFIVDKARTYTINVYAKNVSNAGAYDTVTTGKCTFTY
ncbi:MAG: PKD domain-containing protein [Ruminococcaceae bacterium]|nr:PKD domain-containing protein [Oscillospiraceae bacterium]